MEFDPSSPPFWEKDRGTGPVMDVERSRRKLSGRFVLFRRLDQMRAGVDRIRARLEQPCWPVEYKEFISRIRRLRALEARIWRRLCGSRVNGSEYEVWHDERVLLDGADGKGNRWVGHGIKLR